VSEQIAEIPGEKPSRKIAEAEVVVVTGASAGLGRAIVRLFASEGAHVGLLARGLDGLEGARRDVEALGGRAMVVPVDVADAGAIEDAAEKIEAAFGPIDIWINNAMVSVFSPVEKMTAEEYKRVTEVTYLGVVYGTLAALKRMRPRDRGCIIQVGSALAYRGIPLQSAYCAAKHAIQGFHDSLRSELIHDNSHVRVTMVQLPAMNTPQFSWVKSRLPRKPQPVPPIYQPEIGAAAVFFAAHNDRREMYVGYPTIEAIIGDKIAPGFADWYLAKNGFAAQQTDEPVEPDRRDNLWEPVPGDHGAHGTFDARAAGSSPQLWLSKNRNWLAVAGAGLAAATIGLVLKRNRSKSVFDKS
jgi:NAD(P)-dependent dehydrogenase (short-subunit alcohol dehydrogenase family)